MTNTEVKTELKSYSNHDICLPEYISIVVGKRRVKIFYPIADDMVEVTNYINLCSSLSLISQEQLI